MNLKMPSGKWQPYLIDLNILTWYFHLFMATTLAQGQILHTDTTIHAEPILPHHQVTYRWVMKNCQLTSKQSVQNAFIIIVRPCQLYFQRPVNDVEQCVKIQGGHWESALRPRADDFCAVNRDPDCCTHHITATQRISPARENVDWSDL